MPVDQLRSTGTHSLIFVSPTAYPSLRARPGGQLAPAPALPFFFKNLMSSLFQELWLGPFVHIKIVLDVTVLEHEILPDLDAFQVLGTQARHHVDVLDAL